MTASLSELVASLHSMRTVELSHVLHEGIQAFAGHPEYRHIERSSLRDNPSAHFEVVMSEHSGTHLDAPSHILNGAGDVMTFRATLTRAAVLRPTDRERDLTVADLERFEDTAGPITAGDSVLVDHGWATRWGHDSYMSGWPSIEVSVAECLADRGVVLLAADTPSPDAAACDRRFPVHETMLGTGAFIGENFADLSSLGDWCLLDVVPLPIEGGSGSPVRAMARV